MIPEPVPSLIAEIATAFGPIGVVVCLLIYALIYKDREGTRDRKELEKLLLAEKDARIADAKGFTEVVTKLQSQVIDAVSKLSLILDELRKGRRP